MPWTARKSYIRVKRKISSLHNPYCLTASGKLLVFHLFIEIFDMPDPSHHRRVVSLTPTRTCVWSFRTASTGIVYISFKQTSGHMCIFQRVDAGDSHIPRVRKKDCGQSYTSGSKAWKLCQQLLDISDLATKEDRQNK
uniref:Uncharacterized protein n=1 Tax=Glossina pallidipes TaxID=7398 RepID=A0A1A9Z464_GLOPL